MPANILAIGGSNSRKSINKQWASYVALQVPNSLVRTLDLNDFVMPIYGIDLEREKGIPPQAMVFRQHVEWADGIVVSLAEHNGSYTTSIKNVIDWTSRINKAIWMHKPMFLTATAPGSRGAINVLQHALTYFPRLGANIVGTFSLPFYRENFNMDEGILDEDLEASFEKEIKVFKQSVSALVSH